MGEAFAIIGLVAAIVGLVDFSTKVIERLSDFTSKTDDVPEAFRAINTQLPLFSNTLQQVQAQAKKGYIDVPTAKALTTVVVNSINLTTTLEAILEKTLPGRNATAFQKRLAALKSLGKDKEVLKCRDQLESNIGLLVFYQTTHQSGVGEKIQLALSSLETALEKRASSFGRDLRPKEHSKCLRALYTSDYEALKRSVPSRLSGTCTWFSEHPQYLKWHQELDSSLLWLSADAGCGKSVISSYLVDELIGAESQAELPGIVCHFFFKDDIDGILALQAVLHQLFTQSPSSVKHAIGEYNSKGKGFTKEFDTLWNIFLDVICDSESRIVICVLDALDECSHSTREQLINSITKLFADPRSHRVKFFVTSRPFPSIHTRMKKFPSIRLEKEIDLLGTIHDIKLVVQKRVSKISADKTMSLDQQNHLENILLKNADRTFLWISLVLDMIEDIPSTSRRALDEMLSTIPTRLEDTYEKALSQIPLKDIPPARKVIHIMLAAVEPLDLEEMNTAFSISDENKSWQEIDFEGSIGDYVRHLLPRIVKVVDSKFYFVHHTVKEFLSNADPIQATHVEWKHSCYSVEANYVLANICTRYLMLSDFEGKQSLYVSRTSLPLDISYYSPENSGTGTPQKSEDERDTEDDEYGQSSELNETRASSPNSGVHMMSKKAEQLILDQSSARTPSAAASESSDQDFDESKHWMRILKLREIRQIPFLIYAAQYWSIHLLAAQATSSSHESEIELLALKLCDSNSHYFRAWYQVWHFRESFDQLDCPQTCGLHLIAYLGLSKVIPLALKQDIDVNIKDGNNNTALHAVVCAAMKGRPWKDVTEMLLKCNSDPNTQNGKGRTALHMAVYETDFYAGDYDIRHEFTSRILEAHPDVDIQDFEGMTVLQCAAIVGDEKIAQLLLDEGANVNLADKRDETALFSAVYGGHLLMVQTLLNAGADKEKQNYSGLTALAEGLRTYLALEREMYSAPIQKCIELMVEHRAKIPLELIQDFEDEVGQPMQSDTELLAWLFDTARKSRLPRFKDFLKAKGWIDETLW